MAETTKKSVFSVNKVTGSKRILKKVKPIKGLKIERVFTKANNDPYSGITFEKRSCKITNPDGSTIFELKDIEVPRSWSKVASDILLSKYIRKNGIPQFDEDGKPVLDKSGNQVTTGEKSAKQVIDRMADCWTDWGKKYNYFASDSDAKTFADEMKYMLVNQFAAPNSPQWFNTGLAYSYGITGPAQGHWYADPKDGKLKLSEDAYTHPQPHACFIQSVSDDLVNKGGIFDLITREARIFKYGSGSGTNFSSLRGDGEPLSGGGKSSGLMSWLEILDKAAGSIKSGGTTRRASKMVILNVDHPDIETFIDWKLGEEKKAAHLIAAGYSQGIDGEAYHTVGGQNSNNSIRVSDEFMAAVENDGEWALRWRTKPDEISKTVKAKQIWHKIANSTWHCGDPGVQFDTTVNDWHTCLSSGRINGSNPCSEFMFLDNSSCNLASINLLKFFNEKDNKFDVESFSHASRLWTIVLEISVLMAQFPSYEIAENSYLYRPLGLGYANLGALLMVMGLPYDSEDGRGVAGGITSLMTGQAYTTSAEMASHMGPFKMYTKNKEDMSRVIRNHRRAAYNETDKFENLSLTPWTLKEENCPQYLLEAARSSWDSAMVEGRRFGFRNAQVTLLAPTGTIGLVMDCDTTGIEPDYALVKFKKLAGGGYFKIINQSVPRALDNLGYSKRQIDAIIEYVIGTGSLKDAPHVNNESLLKKGFREDEIEKIEKSLPGVFDLNQAFNVGSFDEETLSRVGIKVSSQKDYALDLLAELGFSHDHIREANDYICGMMTMEGAPELDEKHLAIFDCANKSGQYGKRFISPEGHVKMMAATQPFLSGAISKTVNVDSGATVEDIEEAYLMAWKLGIKAVAIYRDGSKLTQPLSAKEDKSEVDTSAPKEVVVEYRPIRKRLPKERMSITRKVTIGGHKIFLTVGLYPDGKPGEIFISMNQQGSFAAGMADSFAKMASIGLQYGVPVETIVSQLKHSRFQPMGFTGDSDISNVSSIADFIARWLEQKFLADGAVAMKLPFQDEKIPEQTTQIKMEKKEVPEEKLTGKQGDIFGEELGYSGETCPDCGSNAMVQNGKCHKCVNCGATTGCS